ncbi:hypothetical protein CLV92_104219 [Kineococcus xinjiangensis]|uniref:DUF2867 domain-containing protein n=1 Tax=Kineococcus xinjiangensis TaxID=512762 RepID=A0A2S6IT39_9ACTN|nr:hypothetical protein [Kineococcus xinjiangensis]PPK97398.1 hypothetical protein CLV92_104219 [Kineococcus xinjiangensis]
MSDPIEQFLPVHDHRAVHEIRLAAPPERVWAEAMALTPAELPLPRLLMALRSLPQRLRGGGAGVLGGSAPLAELFRADGRWITLVEEPGRLILVGRAARFSSPVPDGPSAVQDARGFAAWTAPGLSKAVVLHEVVPEGAGSRLVTETRIRTADPASRRVFAAYWFLIRPGVGLIRRSVLRAVARRCAGPAGVRGPLAGSR